MTSYFVQNGDFEQKNEKILFHGKEVSQVDPNTKEEKLIALYGDFLFPNTFKAGTISFDVTFDDVCEETRCGVIFDYKNTDRNIQLYQIGLRNFLGSNSLDRFNNASWEFLLIGGAEGTIKARQKYSISVELNGNTVCLTINGVRLFSYSKIVAPSGGCGVFIVNKADAVIENISVNTEKPTVFSIMKYNKDFDELYHDVVAPMCDLLGYQSVRADECYTSSFIIQDIIREISNATIVIADITMDNPNVFYELGYAHALGKPTILLADAEKRESLPFDISGYRTVFYSNTIGGKSTIEETLRKFMENINS